VNPTLSEFLSEQREAIVARARARVAERRVPVASPRELTDGVPLFLGQITAVLRTEEHAPSELPPTTEQHAHDALGGTADRVGDDMLRAGLSVAQVVQGYGDVCQAITEHAAAEGISITPDGYRTLNLCLDVATARAVTAFSRERDRSIDRQGAERLGVLAHELRNLLAKASLSYEALRRGAVGIESRTGGLLGTSLRELSDVVDRSLTEVRLAATIFDGRRVLVARFIEDLEIGAALAAKARGLTLEVAPVDAALAVHVDRQLLGSAVGNLLQNAMKYTRPGTRVTLTARGVEGRVFIEVGDECGGFPDGSMGDPFRGFARRSQDESGLGIGLKVSRDAVKANGGEIRLTNTAGQGCLFTIDLPAAA
jgi:signal transduction histidine kinase